MRLLSLLITSFFLFGFFGSDITPLRYDGIYKVQREQSNTYYKFIEDREVFYSYNCLDCKKEFAIEKINMQISDSKNKGQHFFNSKNSVNFSSSGPKFHVLYTIKKNNKGDLKDAIFFQMEEGVIVETIDLRIKNPLNRKILSSSGEQLVEGSYSEVYFYDARYVKVKKNRAYGIYDLKEQKMVVPIEYQYISEVENGMVVFRKNYKYGFFNKDFQLIVEPIYIDYQTAYVDLFVDDIQAVSPSKGKWIFIDKKGKQISSTIFFKVGEYIDRTFVPVILEDKTKIFNYINLTTGKKHRLRSFSQTVYKDKIVHKLGASRELVTDSKGNFIFNKYMQDINPIKTDKGSLYIVKISDKTGVMDNSGKYIIPSIYERITVVRKKDSSDVLFLVAKTKQKRNKPYEEFLLNQDGSKAIQKGYWSIKQISDTVYIAKNSIRGKEYLFNLNNSKKPIFVADKINQGFLNGMFKVQKNSDNGIIDFDGNIIVPIKYEENIVYIKNGFFVLNRVEELYNLKGEVVKSFSDNIALYKEFYQVGNDLYTYQHNLLVTLPQRGNHSFCGKDTFLFNPYSSKENAILYVKEAGHLKIVNNKYKGLTCRVRGNKNFIEAKTRVLD